jgi:hypothetical protein
MRSVHHANRAALVVAGAALGCGLGAWGCAALVGVDFDRVVVLDGGASADGTVPGDDGGLGPDGAPVPGTDAGCIQGVTCTGKCGQVVDTCGAIVDCGSCAAGQTCGAAGPNRCGNGTCTPTCAGKKCGQSDGCSAPCPTGPCAGNGQRCVGGACKCDGTSCSTCCTQNVCVVVATDLLCGTGGATCAPCASGSTCTAGVCTGGPPGWKREQSGTTSSLYAVWGASDTDIYAAGEGGVVLHSTGNGAWATQSTPNTIQTLTGLWGSSNTDLFGVSADLVWRSQGAGSWTFSTRPGSLSLNTIWGTSASDVFIIGASGSLFHSANGGTSWQTPSAGTTKDLLGGWSSSATNAYVVGAMGTVSHLSGTTWQVEPQITGADLFGVWGSSATDVYAVASSGILLHSVGSGTWTMSTISGVTDNLRAITGRSATDMTIVGENGVLLRGTGGGTWTPETGAAGSTMTAVWESPNGEVYAVGINGTILHRH